MESKRSQPLSKLRLVIVSPFVDKRHGTERVIAEQIERLASDYEIHLYSERVEDVDLRDVVWHRVYVPPGPHLFRYAWWFIANHLYRRAQEPSRQDIAAIVYSPGINCFDADIVCTHIVFGELRQKLSEKLRLSQNSVKTWPRVLHRRMYYRLIEALERHIYRNPKLILTAVSEKTAQAIRDYTGRTGTIEVVYNGIDAEKFSVERRSALRQSARAEFGLGNEDVAFLLIGNDWRTKGLPCLLEAIARLQSPRVRVLVVGQDSPKNYLRRIASLGLTGRVSFLPVRSDAERYYAAADVYASPSLDDAFGMPSVEAMACGLAVVTSRSSGASRIMHSGEDALILEDSGDVDTLAGWLRRLTGDAAYRQQLGEAAARTAVQYSSIRNVDQMRALFEGFRTSRKLALQQWQSAPTRFEKS